MAAPTSFLLLRLFVLFPVIWLSFWPLFSNYLCLKFIDCCYFKNFKYDPGKVLFSSYQHVGCSGLMLHPTKTFYPSKGRVNSPVRIDFKARFRKVIFFLLLMSGDIALNPGPLHSTTTSLNFFLQNCRSLKNKLVECTVAASDLKKYDILCL